MVVLRAEGWIVMVVVHVGSTGRFVGTKRDDGEVL